MKINKEQRLYVIESDNGFSCLGFDVLTRWASALQKEMNYSEWNEKPGTKEAYEHYQRLLSEAQERNRATGWRSVSQLHPQLVGLEGKRVEVIDCDGEKYRFIVGKSTGYIPCHLVIKSKGSSGGGPVDYRVFKSVRVINS